jgi:hypothetical protein
VNKSIDDLKHSINILEANIKLFQEGNISVYRVIAVQLYLLLCDKNNALIPRIFRKVRLHPIWGSFTKEQEEEFKKETGHSIKEGLAFQMPAMVRFDGKGGSKIETLFDERREPIKLEEWLNQDLFSPNITIRELIKSVRDKESAHSDKHYDDTLKFTKSVKLVDQDIHVKFIAAIGEYILKMIKMTIEGQTRFIE